MARDFSVFVNIGGKLNASLDAAVKGASSALVGVGRAASQGANETNRAFAGGEHRRDKGHGPDCCRRRPARSLPSKHRGMERGIRA